MPNLFIQIAFKLIIVNMFPMGLGAFLHKIHVCVVQTHIKDPCMLQIHQKCHGGRVTNLTFRSYVSKVKEKMSLKTVLRQVESLHVFHIEKHENLHHKGDRSSNKP